MTIDLDIKKVAIIGGGYSGLQSLAELLHTSATGHSTIASGVRPGNPAFERIKLFELNDQIGGAWNFSRETDPRLPYQEILEKKEYWEPSQIAIEKTSETHKVERELIWKHSGVYDPLYTNISEKYMTPSTIKPRNFPERKFSPFITHREVLRLLKDLVEKFDLEKHIHYNTSVQNVIKTENGKYLLTLRDTSSNEEKWYTEEFDAIIVATGRFQIPHIPRIKNLPAFNAKHPNAVLHSKAFRLPSDFRGKKVLIVGSSVSSLGTLEFLKSLTEEIHLSRKSFSDPNNEIQAHYDEAFRAEGIIQHGEISEFDPENNAIIFSSGETVTGIDHVIFATGYHIHYPFFEKLSETSPHIVRVEKSNGEQRGGVKNLYRYVFTIGEPTIAHIGLISSGFFVNLAESQGVAIAGVWSNARKLPDVEEQRKWLEDHLEATKDARISHHFGIERSGAEIDYLNTNFAPIERPNVFDRINVEEFEADKKKLSEIYELFGTGQLNEDYVLKHDASGL